MTAEQAATKDKHTPGPWEVHYWRSGPRLGREFHTVNGVADVLVAKLYVNDYTEANAFLIAAAPDLLAACREALNAAFGGELSQVAYTAITKAIAKATGGDA